MIIILLEYRMTSQWSNFANYNVGDQVQNGSSTIWGCILANTNEPPPNATYWNNLTPAGTGLTSLQALTNADNGGNLVLASPTATFTTVPSTGTIDMTIAYPAFPIPTINGLTGAITVGDVVGDPFEVITTAPSALTIGYKTDVVGKYVEATGGVKTVDIPANCSATSIIAITYIHTGGGGGSQYIKSITPGAGAFTIECNSNIDIDDEIVWQVLSGVPIPPPPPPAPSIPN